MNTCSIPGCPKIHYGLGFCNLHYTRFKKHGNPKFRLNPELPPPDENNMRRCRKCEIVKLMEEFAKTPNGFTGVCKSCIKDRNFERLRVCPGSRELKRLQQKKTYWKNPEKYRAINRRNSNPERAREKHLKNKYGISEEGYKDILERQKGVCAICKQPETQKGRHLSVDHDHATGEVRGLLCGVCNTAIGLLKDSSTLTQAAADYLIRSQASLNC